MLIQGLQNFSFSRISSFFSFFNSSFNVGGAEHIHVGFLLSIIYIGVFSIFILLETPIFSDSPMSEHSVLSFLCKKRRNGSKDMAIINIL